MSKYPLNPNDVLAKLSTYEIQRDDMHFFIEVGRKLNNPSETPFMAVPISFKQSPTVKGYGTTEEEALIDCLEQIKTLSKDQIFPTDKKPEE